MGDETMGEFPVGAFVHPCFITTKDRAADPPARESSSHQLDFFWAVTGRVRRSQRPPVQSCAGHQYLPDLRPLAIDRRQIGPDERHRATHIWARTTRVALSMFGESVRHAGVISP